MPGFLEDPLTADFSSRNELEEEEEAAIANELPKQYKIKPTIDVRNERRVYFLITLKIARSHLKLNLIIVFSLCSLTQEAVPLAHSLSSQAQQLH